MPASPRIALIALTIPLAAMAGEGGADRIEREIAALGPDVRVGIEVRRLPAPGIVERSLRRDADSSMPTASAIKTAIMIELFAAFADRLDAPAPGLDSVLGDEHPAVAHFRPAQREEIRAGLAGSTVRRIGLVMMGTEKATNLVYNAASNAAIALLGGPEGTTERIHARSPEFAAIMVRRPMLADRKARGDNEASPAALAAVLRRLAERSLPGLAPATIDACRDAVEPLDAPGRGLLRFKNGDLDSPPITRVVTGWTERSDGSTIVHVVMLANDAAAPADPAKTAAQLQRAADRLASLASDLIEDR